MPAIAANANSFNVNSDYPLDKVAYTYSFSVTVPAYSFQDVTIIHNLPFTPLCIGMWSLDSGWSYGYDSNSGPTFGDQTLQIPTAIDSDSTEIIVRNTNNLGTSQTLYWRIFAFAPAGVVADVAPTAVGADDFVFNTDYNYAKLFDSGVTGYSSTVGSTETVYHNLGYRPQVLSWSDYSGGYTRNINVFVADGSVGNNNHCKVYTDRIVFRRDSVFLTSSVRFHYRIYMDEQ